MTANAVSSQNQLSTEQQIGMLDMLRGARAIVQRDAESFDQAASILEHVGQVLAGKVRDGLNHYKDEICDLAKKAPSIEQDRVDDAQNGAGPKYNSTRAVFDP